MNPTSQRVGFGLGLGLFRVYEGSGVEAQDPRAGLAQAGVIGTVDDRNPAVSLRILNMGIMVYSLSWYIPF